MPSLLRRVKDKLSEPKVRRREQSAQREAYQDDDAEAALAFEIDQINTAGMRYIRSYSSAWWEKLSTSRRDALREALLTAREHGLTPKQVANLLRPYFDADRALMIATTELTTVMGQGAVEQYKLSGFGRWEWSTVNDERVCPICNALHGERFPASIEDAPRRILYVDAGRFPSSAADPYNLDSDNDGVACESNGKPAYQAATATPARSRRS